MLLGTRSSYNGNRQKTKQKPRQLYLGVDFGYNGNLLKAYVVSAFAFSFASSSRFFSVCLAMSPSIVARLVTISSAPSIAKYSELFCSHGGISARMSDHFRLWALRNFMNISRFLNTSKNSSVVSSFFIESNSSISRELEVMVRIMDYLAFLLVVAFRVFLLVLLSVLLLLAVAYRPYLVAYQPFA